MSHVTVMTGPERRRRWGDEERFQILEPAGAPGAVVADVADVARRYDVCTSLIYKWRQAAKAEAPAGFMPVMLSAPAGAGLGSGARSRRSWWSYPAGPGSRWDRARRWPR